MYKNEIIYVYWYITVVRQIGSLKYELIILHKLFLGNKIYIKLRLGNKQ